MSTLRSARPAGRAGRADLGVEVGDRRGGLRAGVVGTGERVDGQLGQLNVRRALIRLSVMNPAGMLVPSALIHWVPSHHLTLPGIVDVSVHSWPTAGSAGGDGADLRAGAAGPEPS